MKTKRQSAGCYQVIYKGRTFDVTDQEGYWNVFDPQEEDGWSADTLKEAKADIQELVDRGEER